MSGGDSVCVIWEDESRAVTVDTVECFASCNQLRFIKTNQPG